MPQEAHVMLCVDPAYGIRSLYSVEKRYKYEVHLNDKHFTPYPEEDEE